MSQENVEIAREVFHRAFVRWDLDGALQLIDAEGVMDWSASLAPYRGIYQWHAEIRGTWQQWKDAWDEWTPEVIEAIEIDAETVILVTLIHARGKGSGVPVRAGGASIWIVRHGKVTRVKLFQSKADALDAVGLPE
jgi:ketosteroid isomerase-like protein